MTPLAMLLFSTLLLLISAPFSFGTNVTNATKVITPEYVLRSNSTSRCFNNLYLDIYHTGAGLNDAVFVTNKSQAVKGYLNGTYQQFDLNSTFPWGFQMGDDTNYAGWEPVQINAGLLTQGFFLNSTAGLQWGPAEYYGFGGWLICDWFHGVPQLFWVYSYYNIPFPCNCARANLFAEKV